MHLPLYNLNKSQIKARLSIGRSQLSFPCAIGKNGQTAFKTEGDGKTPIGTWRPLCIYYRRDKVKRPTSPLKIIPIKKSDGWCDDPFDNNYNRPITHPYPAGAEHLWRDDELYDIIIVLDHNHCPRKQKAGSAIFMHNKKPGYPPTEGCIALSKRHLYLLTPHLTKATKIRI